jgi:hypothetical protein
MMLKALSWGIVVLVVIVMAAMSMVVIVMATMSMVVMCPGAPSGTLKFTVSRFDVVIRIFLLTMMLLLTVMLPPGTILMLIMLPGTVLMLLMTMFMLLMLPRERSVFLMLPLAVFMAMTMAMTMTMMMPFMRKALSTRLMTDTLTLSTSFVTRKCLFKSFAICIHLEERIPASMMAFFVITTFAMALQGILDFSCHSWTFWKRTLLMAAVIMTATLMASNNRLEAGTFLLELLCMVFEMIRWWAEWWHAGWWWHAEWWWWHAGWRWHVEWCWWHAGWWWHAEWWLWHARWWW